jgi:hypothetical protein
MAFVIYEVETKKKIAILTYNNLEEQAKKMMLASRILHSINDADEGFDVHEIVKTQCDIFRMRQEAIKKAREKSEERRREKERQARLTEDLLRRITPRFTPISFDFKPTPIEEVVKFFMEQRKSDEELKRKQKSVFIVF